MSDKGLTMRSPCFNAQQENVLRAGTSLKNMRGVIAGVIELWPERFAVTAKLQRVACSTRAYAER